VLVLGGAFLVAAALQPVAGYWLGKSLKRGGRLGASLAVCVRAFGVVFVLPAWVPVAPVMLILLTSGWATLR
jgi:membrane protein YqaA with SNARE-associated domain